MNVFGGLKAGGNSLENEIFFDTLKFRPQMSLNEIKQRAKEKRINLRYYDSGSVSFHWRIRSEMNVRFVK